MSFENTHDTPVESRENGVGDRFVRKRNAMRRSERYQYYKHVMEILPQGLLAFIVVQFLAVVFLWYTTIKDRKEYTRCIQSFDASIAVLNDTLEQLNKNINTVDHDLILLIDELHNEVDTVIDKASALEEL